jgi:phosphoribulokinase
MIAVGGDSGTGKVTLCRGFDLIFGERIGTIALDDYQSLDRAQRNSVGFSSADPRAYNFAAMEEDLWALREGRAIEKPIYDHSNGTFTATERVEPKDIIVVQGLFPLLTRALRSLYDVTVWLDPEPELKAHWKLQRDTLRRGYWRDDVEIEVERRMPDSEKYVAPQARYADLTLRFYRPPDWSENQDPAHLSARIRKGGRFRPLDYSEFESESTSIRQLQTAEGGYPETIIELDGQIAPASAGLVEDRLWSHLDVHGQPRPAQLGEFEGAQGQPKIGYTLALSQLLIARRVVLVEDDLLEMVP